jgi:hypothetical protein
VVPAVDPGVVEIGTVEIGTVETGAVDSGVAVGVPGADVKLGTGVPVTAEIPQPETTIVVATRLVTTDIRARVMPSLQSMASSIDRPNARDRVRICR